MVNSCWGERDSVLSARLRAPHATLETIPLPEDARRGSKLAHPRRRRA